MKDDLAEYLSSKKLEEHISNIIGIVDRHYNKKPSPVRTAIRPVKRKGINSYLF